MRATQRALRKIRRSGRLACSQGIEAPCPRAREDEIEEDEAIDRGELAAVQHRIEIPPGMHHEIGDRREAREDEGNGPREQADREQDAADQLDQAAGAGEGIDLDIGKGGNGGKTKDLSGTMLKQAEPGC